MTQLLEKLKLRTLEEEHKIDPVPDSAIDSSVCPECGFRTTIHDHSGNFHCQTPGCGVSW